MILSTYISFNTTLDKGVTEHYGAAITKLALEGCL